MLPQADRRKCLINHDRVIDRLSKLGSGTNAGWQEAVCQKDRGSPQLSRSGNAHDPDRGAAST